MKFRYTILYVDDVAATIAFYCQAFGVEQKMLHESGDYGELATGQTRLAFSSKTLMEELGKSAGSSDSSQPIFEIAFETDDVESALQTAVNAGAKLIQPAATMPWGQVVAYVEDDNGFLVEICSPVATQP